MSNDPYSRPTNATKPTAQRVGDFYGEVSKHSARSQAAGNPNAAPAIASTAPYLAPDRATSAPLPEFPLLEVATPSPDVISLSDEPVELAEPIITEEDLFG